MKKKVIYKNNFKNDSISLKSITFFKFIYILSITNIILVKLVYKSITFLKFIYIVSITFIKNNKKLSVKKRKNLKKSKKIRKNKPKKQPKY